MSDNNIRHLYINTVITDTDCPGGIRLLRGCLKNRFCEENTGLFNSNWFK